MPAHTPERSDRFRLFIGCIALALTTAILITLLRGESYWNLSDGVYAYTARALLNGSGLYSEIAAAQPPFVYLVGSAFLAVSDSVMGLRLGLALFQAASAVLAAVAIFRLTGNRVATLVGSLLVLLAPRTLHDFSNLMPETIGTPIVVAAAIAAARPKWCLLAGVLGAIAILVKFPFVFPVAAIWLCAADRRRYFFSGVISGLLMIATFWVIFGADFFDGVLFAQSGSGLVDGDLLWSQILQASWNLLPILPLAIVGFALRGSSLDSPLARTMFGGAIGSLLIFITVLKHGSYINLAVAVEPFLVVFAICGAVWALNTKRRKAALALVSVSLIFLLAQAATLLFMPNDPEAFAQPFDSSNHGQVASSDEVRSGATRLRADPCDRSEPYFSSPYMAFAADIRMPGNQGDPFIISVSDVYEKQRLLAETEACR